MVGVVLNPLAMLLVIGFVFRDALRLPPGVENYVLFVVPGVALQVGLASLGPTAITLRSDLDSGMMSRLRSLPVRRTTVLAAHLVTDTLLGTVVLMVVLGAGLGLGWRPDVSVGTFVVGLALCLLFIVLCVCSGMLLGSLMRSAESIDAVGALILVIASFVSDLLISSDMTPSWFSAISQANPISVLVGALRAQWGGGGTVGTVEVASLMTAMVVLTVLCLVLLARRLDVLDD